MASTRSPKIPFESLASLVISPNKCEQHNCWTSPPCIMQIKTYKNIIKLENPTSSKFIHSHLRANSAKQKPHLFQRWRWRHLNLIRQPISVGTKEPPNASHQNTLFVFFWRFLTNEVFATCISFCT